MAAAAAAALAAAATTVAAPELPLLAVPLLLAQLLALLLALLLAQLLAQLRRRWCAELSAPRPLTAGQHHAMALRPPRCPRPQAVQALRGTSSSTVDRYRAVAPSPSSWAGTASRHLRPPSCDAGKRVERPAAAVRPQEGGISSGPRAAGLPANEVSGERTLQTNLAGGVRSPGSSCKSSALWRKGLATRYASGLRARAPWAAALPNLRSLRGPRQRSSPSTGRWT